MTSVSVERSNSQLRINRVNFGKLLKMSVSSISGLKNRNSTTKLTGVRMVLKRT